MNPPTRKRKMWAKDWTLNPATGRTNSSPLFEALTNEVRDAATRYERCCDLWQDSLGQMHCTECSQKTFAMLREIQELFGVGKDGRPSP